MQYYIQLFSPHGLLKYHNPEIGRDRDTGGQVKYVLDLMEHLSHHPQIRKIDLFTRRIVDKELSADYSRHIERVNDKARIIRIDCGGNAYREKETLWPYLDEFVDNTISFTEEEAELPDVVHGHYADGNYIAAALSKIFGCLFLATGHSLGRNKINMLKEQGLEEAEIVRRFKMDKRIKAEENTLCTADRIIVSTNFEITSQYREYTNFPKAAFEVIPPGINSDIFYPFYRQDMPAFTMTPEQEFALYHSNSEIERFLFRPEKPLILSLGRPDKRKNFDTIISTYGEDKELQSMANLAIFAGVRNDISEMQEDEKEILTNLLLLLDKYDLYGKMAIPKKNDPLLEVPEIYRIAARRKGVFVNATPGENFGLTIIEAAACGLPVIASPQGGPKDIIENAQNGILVCMDDKETLSAALKKIIADSSIWEEYSAKGIAACAGNYSWESHVETYLQLLTKLMNSKTATSGNTIKKIISRKFENTNLLLLSDLDGTLIEGHSNNPGLNRLKT